MKITLLSGYKADENSLKRLSQENFVDGMSENILSIALLKFFPIRHSGHIFRTHLMIYNLVDGDPVQQMSLLFAKDLNQS